MNVFLIPLTHFQLVKHSHHQQWLFILIMLSIVNLIHTTRSFLVLSIFLRVVFPVQERKTATLRNYPRNLPSVFPRGVVYYVYSNDICQQGTKYINEALKYTTRLKQMSPEVESKWCFWCLVESCSGNELRFVSWFIYSFGCGGSYPSKWCDAY